MKNRVLGPILLGLAAGLAGCGPSPGAAGLWDLRVGGPARIVGEGGAAEVVLKALEDAPARTRARRAGTPKVDSVTLSAGTAVEVLAVDGDDARIRVGDGPHAGSVYWIECRHLRPVD